MLLIETRAAVHNIKSICKVEGIDSDYRSLRSFDGTRCTLPL